MNEDIPVLSATEL